MTVLPGKLCDKRLRGSMLCPRIELRSFFCWAVVLSIDLCCFFVMHLNRTELDTPVELPRASLTTSTVTRTNTEISSENFDSLHRTGPVEFGSYTTGLTSLGRNGFLNEASRQKLHLWLRTVKLRTVKLSAVALLSHPLPYFLF